MKSAIIVSGYFNPLHKGHIDYFKLAKENANKLFVIVNNDKQRALKGSKKFQEQSERILIISELKIVDEVFLSVDLDRSVCETIKLIHNIHGLDYKLYFGNGGDQSATTSPETPVCNELGINVIDNLGSKIQSSSWLLNSKNEK